LNLPEREITDFSVNLNPLGMPEVISKNWDILFDAVMDYPDIEGQGIVDFYTYKTGVQASEFLAGNGSTELIYLIPRVLKFKKVLIPTPSFHDYERASILAGSEVVRFPLNPENSFSFPSEDELINAVDEADAMFVGCPNNPTAGMFSKDIIIKLATQYPEKYFIVDEAFIQFVDDWKAESLISSERHPNILVIHSFTKFYAIAGLRMGGVIGHRGTIDKLKQNKEPWSVNGIADKAALLLMGCEEYESHTIKYLNNERERVFKELIEIDGIEPFQSRANFFLCKWKKTGELDDLIKYLLKNGIYIRDCRNFSGLEDNYFRFGIRSVKEDNLLLSLLSSFEKVN
jgi:threonine-phosphate decarboxylase